jgi:hypothetical protein
LPTGSTSVSDESPSIGDAIPEGFPMGPAAPAEERAKCRLNLPLRVFSRLAPNDLHLSQMTRLGRSLPIAATTLALAAFLASCGGGGAKLLPGATARDITANLSTVKQLADEGDCVGAESAAQQVDEQVEALTGVDAKLKQALEKGATRLNEVVATCEETITETVAPTTVPTQTVPEKPKKEPKEKKSEEKEGEEEAVVPSEEEGEEVPPSLPPQANGKAKGHEPPAEEEGPASGGVSPNSTVGEEG